MTETSRQRRAISPCERTRRFDQLDRGLFTDAGNAGQVVGRIALEAAIVRQLARFEIEACAHGGGIVAQHAAHARAHGDRRPVVDDLQEIVVARHHDRLRAVALRLGRERGDNVVRLFAFHVHHRNVVDFEHAPHERELRTQIVGHRFALGLVGLEDREARGGQPAVETRDHVRRFLVGQELDQRRGEDVRGFDAHAARGRERTILHREERGVHEPVRIEQHQRRRGRYRARGGPLRRWPRLRRREDVEQGRCGVVVVHRVRY